MSILSILVGKCMAFLASGSELTNGVQSYESLLCVHKTVSYIAQEQVGRNNLLDPSAVDNSRVKNSQTTARFRYNPAM